MNKDTRPTFSPCERMSALTTERKQVDLIEDRCCQEVAYFNAQRIFGLNPGKCQLSGYEDLGCKCLTIVVFTKDGQVYGDVYCIATMRGTLYIDLLDEPRRCFERDIFRTLSRLWFRIRRLPEWMGFSTEVEVDLNGGLKLEILPIV